jgi:hypothetical protein
MHLTARSYDTFLCLTCSSSLRVLYVTADGADAEGAAAARATDSLAAASIDPSRSL